MEDLSVVRNLLFPYEPSSRLGLVSRRASFRAAERILASFDVTSISPHSEIRDLSLSDRQKIEIVRAAARSPRLLLLDEPTSALSASDVEWLYNLVSRLKENGVVVVFISHRISEIRDFCDSISILRNGRHVATESNEDVSDAQIVRLVIGRSLDSAFPEKLKAATERGVSQPVLSVRDLHVGTAVNGTSLELRRGQILGLAALDGMGQRELYSALFGMAVAFRGEIRVGEREFRPTSPLDAIRAGIGYVPSDRRREGVLVRQSGALNMSLPVLDDYAQFGVIDWPRLREAIALYLEKLKIHPRALYRDAGSFSGGNQQKIVIAKWLLAGPPILLMNDPTRGVDVGTKLEIFTIMREFADSGGAILFHSTELNELINMCGEVVVMYKGRSVETIFDEELSEEYLMRSMLGENANESRA
ncbi:Ribose import ATP-binding protein RbsA [Oceanibacterium hippocampi]|uniref:Ribose import ATP-binding protein RbsA n=1 Tax=Oceanibacterium hippocampi TaxID=745714 RepID=A0A1Y5TWB1_9PROT|nr:Ribose import ATP-binding protein RbsA [Oceanibacterium hippocampi]